MFKRTRPSVEPHERTIEKTIASTVKLNRNVSKNHLTTR